MKLATLRSDQPDGKLVIVSRDGRQAVVADFPNLQAALDDWSEALPLLQARYDELNAGRLAAAFPFDPLVAAAPLPRCYQWLDASAFQSHGDLMSKVFKIDNPQTDRPLMYQGMSHEFLSGTEDVVLPCEGDGIDFEGEFGIITDAVPMAVSVAEASRHIRLIVQINDWSLRILAPVEMKTGFGWIQAKPACSVAPIAVTPDELGSAWSEGRVALPLHVSWNGKQFGAANGRAMAFSFPELVAHAARTRKLCAATIIGSGTVSNENYREIGSSCIAERRGIELLDCGRPVTGYMRFGDSVSMRATAADGSAPFGIIDQRVVASASRT
jgi:fumarylacetoacetate (FAA) hydrolase